jgi:hypothetical protein
MKEIIKILVLSLFLLGFSAEYPLPPKNRTSIPPSRDPHRGFAAGGSTDLTCRAVGSVAPKYFSQPIVSMPKPGSGARRPPESHLLQAGRLHLSPGTPLRDVHRPLH